MTAPASTNHDTKRLTFTGSMRPEYASVWTPEATEFVASLVERFTPTRNALLQARIARQAKLNEGEKLDFLKETVSIREGDWKVAPIPADLQDRRVEITGPVERKMIINALNSGAKVFMADFEDSLTPSWDKVMEGQINLRDAVNRSISFQSAPENGKEGKSYHLNDKIAVLIVRPRGWHLDEKHVAFQGRNIPGALLDFGLYLFHNAKTQLLNQSGPYFYLPKLESHKEAQLWADIFAYSEEYLDLEKGTIKATVLIETITATFEMEEILYALRDYCVGLNCGRWDYLFSFSKKFNADNNTVLPERGQVTMTVPFLRAYSLLLIHTCHKRGAFAMGGMAAFIPVKSDEAANDKAIAMVRADKEREVTDGHDGTWVAHPGLVPVAMEIFDKHMPAPNQLHRLREDVTISAADLVEVPKGTITENGLRNNISVSLQYLASWLGGNGCVPINNLMEDAATAEIARSQVWQWVHHAGGALDDGRKITLDMVRGMMKEEEGKIRQAAGDSFDAERFAKAAQLFDGLVASDRFTEFLTLPGYDLIG